MNQKELIQFIEQWENTMPIIYKTNIKRLFEINNKDARIISSKLEIPYNTARSFLNPSHPARIPFLTALKLAEFINQNVEIFLKKVEN